MVILTGQREDEIAGMKWSELDGGLWRIPQERHKGKRGHDVPQPPAVMELLEALPRVGAYVFAGRGGRPIGDFSGIKEEVVKLSGVTGWRWHDLRRTCGS